jgi:hypothetical protein
LKELVVLLRRDGNDLLKGILEANPYHDDGDLPRLVVCQKYDTERKQFGFGQYMEREAWNSLDFDLRTTRGEAWQKASPWLLLFMLSFLLTSWVPEMFLLDWYKGTGGGYNWALVAWFLAGGLIGMLIGGYRWWMVKGRWDLDYG